MAPDLDTPRFDQFVTVWSDSFIAFASAAGPDIPSRAAADNSRSMLGCLSFSFIVGIVSQLNNLLLHNAIDASLNMVCNSGMNDTELISHYGGPAKLARLLGFPEQGGVQRIHNWTTRGIPPAVKVQFPEIFLNVPADQPSSDTAQEAATTPVLAGTQEATHG